jgi:hypothetical protein
MASGRALRAGKPMISFFFNLLFGCRHKRYTWPITVGSQQLGMKRVTYVVCLTCGQEFVYDWQQMKPVGRLEYRRSRRSATGRPMVGFNGKGLDIPEFKGFRG